MESEAQQFFLDKVGGEKHTIGDMYKAISSIDNIEDARTFFEGYVEWMYTLPEKDRSPDNTPEEVAQSNIGWFFGEGMKQDKIKMWREAWGASHPVFGSIRSIPIRCRCRGKKKGEVMEFKFPVNTKLTITQITDCKDGLKRSIGSGFREYVTLVPAKLKEAFGDPTFLGEDHESFDGKVSGEYFFEIGGEFYTLYEYKMTTLYSKYASWTPEKLWSHEGPIQLYIGGTKSTMLGAFIAFLEAHAAPEKED